MTGSHAYRDARLALLQRAIPRTMDPNLTWAMSQENNLWQRADWSTADDTVVAVGLEMLWRDLNAAATLPDDPVRKALKRASPISADMVAEIQAYPRDDYRRQGFEAAVRAAAKNRTKTFDEIVLGAHRLWLLEDPATRIYPFEDVGVLMPLRLETFFTFRDGEWWVRVRVLPQPPSMDTHNPRLLPDPLAPDADDEARARYDDELRRGPLAAATAFWRAVDRTGRMRSTWFDRQVVKDAFAQLAKAVGPARASWIVTATKGAYDGDDIVAVPIADADPVASQRIIGLPPHLDLCVWQYDDGEEAFLPLGTLPNDEENPDAEIPASIDVELFSNFDEASESWLTDWRAAVAIGLAGEFRVPDGLEPRQLGGIAVVGLGDERPTALLTDQVLAGQLADVALGSATNSVGGEPTASSTTKRDGVTPAEGAPSIADWLAVTAARIDGTPTMLSDPMERYLAGGPLPPIARPVAIETRESDRDEAPDGDEIPATGLSRLVTRALWPALWGGWMTQAWPRARPNLAPLTEWALDFVAPEGPLPALSFGSQPYGVLPVTLIDQWQARPQDGDAVRRLPFAVASIRRGLHRALRTSGSVAGEDGLGVDEQRFTELLGRSGVSHAFAQVAYARNREVVMSNAAVKPAIDALGVALQQWFGDLGLSFDPSTQTFWTPVLEASPIGLPLVAPPRHPVWYQGDAVFGLPIAYFLELYSDVSDRIRMNNPAREIEDLFGPDGYSSLDIDGGYGEGRTMILPDSVLVRLLAQSVVSAKGWRSDPELEPLWKAHYEAALKIANLLGDTEPIRWERGPAIEGTVSGRSPGVPDIPLTMDADVKRRLERAVGATIDSVTTRIDPWVTSFAWQRLRGAASSASPNHRLGAYGWVYGPFDGTPGPTGSGLLHTPSLAQTVTASILRDRYLESVEGGYVNELGGHPWDMRLNSATVRTALDIAEDLRSGIHLYDVVGREVERILAAEDSPSAETPYQRIRKLRERRPLHPDVPSPHQVCHGIDALELLLGAPGPDFPLSGDQRDRLGELRDSIDALADLLVIEGLTHSLGRSTHKAASAMEASAGLGVMPELEFIQTKPSGFQVESTVLSVLPLVDADEKSTAAQLADPSVAAFLADRLGADWEWRVTLEDGSTHGVQLDDLGLAPIHTLAWSPDQLARLAAAKAGARTVEVREETARAWLVTGGGLEVAVVTTDQLGQTPAELAELTDATIRRKVLEVAYPPPAKAPAGTVVEVTGLADARMWSLWDELGRFVVMLRPPAIGLASDAATPPDEELHHRLRVAAGQPRATSIASPVELRQSVELCAALGAPATERSFAVIGTPPPANTGAFEELRARYIAAHQKLSDAQTAASKAGGLTKSGEPDQRAAIVEAARWGFTPDASPADAATFHAALCGTAQRPGATTMRDLVRQAAAVLQARLDAAPKPGSLPSAADIATPLADALGTRAKGVPDGVSSLAEALSTLVSPQGRVPILVEWDAERLRAATGIVEAPEPDLDEEWLTVVAAVRTPLARLESVQLGPRGLSAWTNSPGDPWMRTQVAANVDARTAHGAHRMSVPRLRAAFGPADAFDGPRVAVGVIDAFTENVPMQERDTHAAFGFNAPAARAPQAILLAVSPTDGRRLDSEALHEMLRETRELMVARTASTEAELKQFAAVMRTLWLPDPLPVGFFDRPAFVKP